MFDQINAMVLAAGLGTRMKAVSQVVPKPLNEVLGEPLLAYALKNWALLGAKKVAINTHLHHKQIAQFIDSRSWPFQVQLFFEPTLLGTGGGIKGAEHFLADASKIMVANADALMTIPAKDMLHSFDPQSTLAGMLLKEIPDPEQFGVVLRDQQARVRDIVGLLACQEPGLLKRMFCGVHVLSPRFFEYLNPGPSCVLRQGYVPALQHEESITSWDHAGYFCDVGTPRRLFEANMAALKNQTGEEAGCMISPMADVSALAVLKGPVMVSEGAVIAANAVVGPNVVIGKNARVGSSAHVRDAVVFSNANIEKEARMESAIVAGQALVSFALEG